MTSFVKKEKEKKSQPHQQHNERIIKTINITNLMQNV